jgi:hypothetical protein
MARSPSPGVQYLASLPRGAAGYGSSRWGQDSHFFFVRAGGGFGRAAGGFRCASAGEEGWLRSDFNFRIADARPGGPVWAGCEPAAAWLAGRPAHAWWAGRFAGQVWGAGDGIGPRRICPGFRLLPALGRLFQGQGIPIARRRAPSTAHAVRCLPAGERVTTMKGGSLPGCGQASVRRDLTGSEAMASWPRGRGFTPRVGQEFGRRLQGAGERVPFREGNARGPGPRR